VSRQRARPTPSTRRSPSQTAGDAPRKPTSEPGASTPLANRFLGLRREGIGFLLLAVAVLTVLGLSGISSGVILAGWAGLVRRLFGWGAYLLSVGVGFAGLCLIWHDLIDRLSLGPHVWVGAELLLLVLLVGAHAPRVLRSGSDLALEAARAGQGGGLVGWALATPLMEALGATIGSLVLLVGLGVALILLLPISWRDLTGQLHWQARRLAATWGRWRTAGQGSPVLPVTAEPPWWEREPSEAEEGSRSSRKPRRAASRHRAKRTWDRPEAGDLPPLDLLDPMSQRAYSDTDVRVRTQIIEETLASFGVPARVVEVRQGPTVTQFGLDPGYIERRAADGRTLRQRVRVGRISSLVDDLALALAAAPLRIEAPVPGRSVVGLEVPNSSVSLVSLRGVIESNSFRNLGSRLAIALGEDVAGQAVAVDLALMPHLLIAGATGSGKSVCINAIVCCLLFNNRPQDLKMLMVDPKMVELIGYNGIPHLLAPVIVDLEQVVSALAWVSRQMDERYRLFHQAGVRNLEQYNGRLARRKDSQALPTLVVLIDELADLMMMAPDEVERHICRLAQMGRATGIHLVIATQRPSVDVVTGLIKANFSARVSFAVTSQVDSRVILDQNGAESLLGRGDMLFAAPQIAAPIRLQGCFVSDPEIERLADFWRNQGSQAGEAEETIPWSGDVPRETDSLLQKAVEVARGRERISTSFMQRQLRIGFPRAARLMDEMEDLGLVGPDEGGGRGRVVYVDSQVDWDEIDERLPGVEPGRGGSRARPQSKS
jgi:DNA segregation ATPase FtsK/SpoIIIE, S-DNA-T family